MMGSNTLSLRSLAISLLVAFSIFVVGCTDVDDSLGLNFVPENQKTKVVFKEFTGIQAYLTKNDSIQSNNQGVAFLGTKKSNVFGTTHASALLQFLPGRFANEDERFGYKPVADTLKMRLKVKNSSGKAIPGGQKFYIYRVKDKVSRDSTYYTWFDGAAASELTPLFEFMLNKSIEEYIYLQSVGEAGTKFMQELVNASKDVYDKDTLFYKTFKGLYIAPELSADMDKEIFCAGLKFEESHLLMIYHNHDKDSVENAGGSISEEDALTGKFNKDTLSMAFYFDDTQYSPNTSINCIKHDYAGTQITINPDDTAAVGGRVTETSYVQTLAGVTTYLRLPDEFVAKIKSDISFDRSEYSKMQIKKAMITFKLKERPVTPEIMNAAPNRLGMYHSYSKKFAGIPDYYYQYEEQGGKLQYNGNINRSHGYYAMDITNYIQQLMITPSTQRTIFLAPDVKLIYSFGEIALSTPSNADDPEAVKISITYTLIK